MIGTSWTGTNRPLVFDDKTTVLDECQISSSEYKLSRLYDKYSVLDECQISSSEYQSFYHVHSSVVLDECQISSSEYTGIIGRGHSYGLG